jgi:hypothetical protein
MFLIWLATAILFLTVSTAQAQTPPRDQPQARNWSPTDTDPDYTSRKQAGTPNYQPPVRNLAPTTTNNLPACFEPFYHDGTDGWATMIHEDDNSVGPINLGWDFSLFGSIYNQVYINNNGNITFTGPYSEFNASGFPTGQPMVAAFWADVDTRSTGNVSYKVYGDRLVVTWDQVGYWGGGNSKTNTFQLVIKANTAPGFSGNDILLSYGDMQWTTGSYSTSGGVDGFGGKPATVGVNRGNNIDYIQVGRFNLNSNQAPNGSGAGDPGGINWLDNQCLSSEVHGQGNLSPVVSGMPADNTITLNQGESRTVTLQFSGPETNQNVNVSANLSGLCSASNSVNANNSPYPTATFTVTGSACNVGITNVTFTATDNGSPAATKTFTLKVIVNSPAGAAIGNNGINSPTQNSFCGSGDPTAIMGSSPTGGTGAYTYQWQSSTDNQSFSDINGATVQHYDPSALNQTTYFRRIVRSGSSEASVCQSVCITINSLPVASLSNTGMLTDNNSVVTLAATGGVNYAFSSGATQQGGSSSTTAKVTRPGLYSVTVTAAGGCSATAQSLVTGASSMTVCRNGSGGINVVVSGNPVKYEWYRNSMNSARLVENPAQVKGTSTSSLSLVNQQVTANYYMRVTDANGSVALYGPFKFTVDLSCNIYARVGAEEVELRVTLLGNPISGEQLRATVAGATGRTMVAELRDLSGRLIQQQRWEQAEADQPIEWNLSGQPSGLYILQATADADSNTPAQRHSLKVVKP